MFWYFGNPQLLIQLQQYAFKSHRNNKVRKWGKLSVQFVNPFFQLQYKVRRELCVCKFRLQRVLNGRGHGSSKIEQSALYLGEHRVQTVVRQQAVLTCNAQHRIELVLVAQRVKYHVILRPSLAIIQL